MASKKCIHHWYINDEGMGRCLKCGEKKQHATRANVDELVSREQKTKGIAEVNENRILFTLMPS